MTLMLIILALLAYAASMCLVVWAFNNELASAELLDSPFRRWTAVLLAPLFLMIVMLAGLMPERPTNA